MRYLACFLSTRPLRGAAEPHWHRPRRSQPGYQTDLHMSLLMPAKWPMVAWRSNTSPISDQNASDLACMCRRKWIGGFDTF